MIQDQLEIAQSHSKSYADKHQRPLKFNIGDHVFLKVSLMKGVLRFRKKDKLNPRFIQPFEILQKISDLAYRLALPPRLFNIYDVFRAFMLRKYKPDPTYVLDFKMIEVDERDCLCGEASKNFGSKGASH